MATGKKESLQSGKMWFAFTQNIQIQLSNLSDFIVCIIDVFVEGIFAFHFSSCLGES